MFKKMEHVGIVVKNIDEASKLYSDIFHLAAWDKGITEIPELGVKVILYAIGDNHIELIQPISTQNRFSKFLKEHGEGLFHITIEVEDFDAEVEALRAKGYTVELEESRSLFPGYVVRLGWLAPETTNGVWIELADLASVPKFFKRSP